MTKLTFVSYAAGSYKRNIFWNRLFVKLFIRPKATLFLTDDDLQQDPIYYKFPSVFCAKRGAGYWAWKPWAILKAMDAAEEGDIILYQDCGKGLRYKNFMRPTCIINHAIFYGAMPGVLIPGHGANKEWTHKQCFDLMECDSDIYYDSPQVEAVVLAWKVSNKNKQILGEWLKFCTNERIISDAYIDHSSSFATQGHRFDQSVLTNLVVKHKLCPVNPIFEDLGLYIFKSMTFLNLFLGKATVFNNVLFFLICSSIRIIRKLRALKTINNVAE